MGRDISFLSKHNLTFKEFKDKVEDIFFNIFIIKEDEYNKLLVIEDPINTDYTLTLQLGSIVTFDIDSNGFEELLLNIYMRRLLNLNVDMLQKVSKKEVWSKKLRNNVSGIIRELCKTVQPQLLDESLDILLSDVVLEIPEEPGKKLAKEEDIKELNFENPIRITETTLREILIDYFKHRQHAKSKMVWRSSFGQPIEISLEDQPNTQESLEYKLHEYF